MLTMQLLENESIRNFIYDESPRKLLIGSRRIGKTSALLLNMFRNSTGPLPRDSFYIVSFSKGINTIKDNLLKICKDFNYKHIYFLVEMFYYVLQGVNKYNIPEFRKEEK